jgi:hypothetical protein
MGRLGRVWAVDNLSFKKGRKQTKKKKKKKKKTAISRERCLKLNTIKQHRPHHPGAMRTAYDLVLCDEQRNVTVPQLLAKFYMDPSLGDREAYFRDVRTQMVAKQWAAAFNRRQPPKAVDFVDAWVLELVDRPGRPVCAAERRIPGTFEKHNTNVGGTLGDGGEWAEERNTPQAFSHFTYEASGGALLVCDIQGVGDVYTDPQIHALQGDYGKGNFGATGMRAFNLRHACNAVCTFLRLPVVNKLKRVDRGTKPEEEMRALIKEAREAEAREEAERRLHAPIVQQQQQQQIQQQQQQQSPGQFGLDASVDIDTLLDEFEADL